jgi:predicted MPP superfamily phosphohydrolase
LFDNATATTRELSAQLQGLVAPVIFTSGNHEAYTRHDNVRQMLSPAKIRWLRNEVMEFKGIRIIGVDNSYGTELLQSVLGRTPPSTVFTVLMNHQPRGFDVAARHRIDLMLSGHVHNGQIWPFNYIVGLFYPYLNGLTVRGRIPERFDRHRHLGPADAPRVAQRDRASGAEVVKLTLPRPTRPRNRRFSLRCSVHHA